MLRSYGLRLGCSSACFLTRLVLAVRGLSVVGCAWAFRAAANKGARHKTRHRQRRLAAQPTAGRCRHTPPCHAHRTSKTSGGRRRGVRRGWARRLLRERAGVRGRVTADTSVATLVVVAHLLPNVGECGSHFPQLLLQRTLRL